MDRRLKAREEGISPSNQQTHARIRDHSPHIEIPGPPFDLLSIWLRRYSSSNSSIALLFCLRHRSTTYVQREPVHNKPNDPQQMMTRAIVVIWHAVAPPPDAMAKGQGWHTASDLWLVAPLYGRRELGMHA